jgi:hypothetical protein
VVEPIPPLVIALCELTFVTIDYVHGYTVIVDDVGNLTHGFLMVRERLMNAELDRIANL